MRHRLRNYSKWLMLGIGVKRWLLLMVVGVFLISLGLSHIIHALHPLATTSTAQLLAYILFGTGFVLIALDQLTRNILAPYRRYQQGRVVDVVYAHRKREKGPKVVAIGGGTGLPSVLRGLKPYSSNITAVVTVADDGGSSGRLRRDLGVLPPGDLRNNIAALADDESLMTQLFQHRFDTGDLGGHSFGNLFISALASVTGSIETALIETERVLNIQGRVLPATLDDVNLLATVHLKGMTQAIRIKGESQIARAGGRIASIELSPPDVQAYSESVAAILDADLVVIGPGSLYTSILPNLLVPGITQALRSTSAQKVYICNVATQPGETEGYTVAEHVLALENHIGRGVFQTVLANNAYPQENAGLNTHYVKPVPDGHDLYQRYNIIYTDLTDPDRPWRHDPAKLAEELLGVLRQQQASAFSGKPALTVADQAAVAAQMDDE
ncbi:MAG TPA: gluconeogenesis factor YvcK family protein [Spirillospora sp.]|nr:gluconeogenesis factor YvcK family protein [Spirillospora sp.]